MNPVIFTREELLTQADIAGERLGEWETLGLIIPMGSPENGGTYYTREHREKIIQIGKLLDLGYEMNDIQKIIRKVGLPVTGNESKKNTRGTELLTVGMLAEKIGTSARTIKHWEDKGIIEPEMRSQGGFRLYHPHYVFFGELIKDLQLFGYSLEGIKTISDYFRDFIFVRDHIDSMDPELSRQKLEAMITEIKLLSEKIELFKKGISRWEELVKKNRREIHALFNRAVKLIDKQEK